MTKPTTIDAYLASQPEETRLVLDEVRKTLQKGMPKAQEAISYVSPAYKMHGTAVFFFARCKKHFPI